MDAQLIPLKPPLKGIFEGSAFANFPEGTTPLALNVRPYDLMNSRNRLGQRQGTRKWVSSQFGGNFPIQFIHEIMLARTGPTSQMVPAETTTSTPTVFPASGQSGVITSLQGYDNYNANVTTVGSSLGIGTAIGNSPAINPASVQLQRPVLYGDFSFGATLTFPGFAVGGGGTTWLPQWQNWFSVMGGGLQIQFAVTGGNSGLYPMQVNIIQGAVGVPSVQFPGIRRGNTLTGAPAYTAITVIVRPSGSQFVMTVTTTDVATGAVARLSVTFNRSKVALTDFNGNPALPGTTGLFVNPLSTGSIPFDYDLDNTVLDYWFGGGQFTLGAPVKSGYSSVPQAPMQSLPYGPITTATATITSNKSFPVKDAGGTEILNIVTAPFRVNFGWTFDGVALMGATGENIVIELHRETATPGVSSTTFVQVTIAKTTITVKAFVNGSVVHTYGPFTIGAGQQWAGSEQEIAVAMDEAGSFTVSIGGVQQTSFTFTQFATYLNVNLIGNITGNAFATTSYIGEWSVTTTQKQNNVVGNKYLVGQNGTVWYGDPIGGFAIPTGGTSCFNTTGEVSVTSVGGDFYLVDGDHFLKIAGVDGTVTTMTPTGGALPTGCKLILHYRNRLMLTRDKNNPQMWYMSAVADYGNFDYSVEEDTGAVAGNNSDAGTVSDVVTAAIAMMDDDVIMGGAQSLWKITGDPRAGGSIDNLSYNEGIVGPTSWCRAPDGRVFFLSRTGIQQVGHWTPYGFRIMKPENMTQAALNETIMGINVDDKVIRMEWDGVRHGFYTFVVPQDGAATDGIWYDERATGWWKDTLPSNYGPSCTTVVKGANPTDRLVLLGCYDGYIRTYDSTVTDDDGVAIMSRVQFAPIQLTGPQTRGRIIETQLVFGPVFGCQYSFYVGDSPQEAVEATTPFYTGNVPSDGWQIPDRARIRAQSVVFEISNAVIYNAWSFETGQLTVDAAGKLRK